MAYESKEKDKRIHLPFSRVSKIYHPKSEGVRLILHTIKSSERMA